MRKGEFLWSPERDGGGEKRVSEGGGSRIVGEKVGRVVVPEEVVWGSVRCKRRGGKLG